jgi:hypothetical protein
VAELIVVVDALIIAVCSVRMDALRVKMIANTDVNHAHHHAVTNVALVVPEVVMYYPMCQMIELVKIVVPQQHARLTAR